MTKHCLLYSCLTLLAACLVVSSSFATEAPAIKAWLGEWINIDADTASTARLQIDRIDGKLVIRGFGQCHPTDCDWGTTPLHLSVGTGGANAVTALASWDHGFKQHRIVLRLRSGELVAESIDIHNDASGQTNRSYTETFARKTAPEREAGLVPILEIPPSSVTVDPETVPEFAVVDPRNLPHLAGVGSEACENALKGKIAWNYRGNKQWAPKNITRLCQGAEASVEPARCFERVMHDGVNWGGGTRWQWQNAVDLCEGTFSANATISCFEERIANGVPWSKAIDGCAAESHTATLPMVSAFPEFPWPPPHASAFAAIPEELVKNPGETTRLGDVNEKLIQALEASGYVERSYYAVPDGFALVTRLEQINLDGTPKESGRWSLEDEPLRQFSLTRYLKALFFADPGLFRIIVFVITPHPFSQSATSVSAETAMDWLTAGLNKLPLSVATRSYTDTFSTTALIYIFKKPASEDPTLESPGNLTGRTHLQQSGVLVALGE